MSHSKLKCLNLFNRKLNKRKKWMKKINEKKNKNHNELVDWTKDCLQPLPYKLSRTVGQGTSRCA